MKVRLEIRFGYGRRSHGASAGFGIGWARWHRRVPATGRRLSVRVARTGVGR